MSTHAATQVLMVGLALEVVYRTCVHQHIRAYLGIEAS